MTAPLLDAPELVLHPCILALMGCELVFTRWYSNTLGSILLVSPAAMGSTLCHSARPRRRSARRADKRRTLMFPISVTFL